MINNVNYRFCRTIERELDGIIVLRRSVSGLFVEITLMNKFQELLKAVNWEVEPLWTSCSTKLSHAFQTLKFLHGNG